MSFDFAVAEVPTVTRESEPNPFHEVVGALAENRDEARTFSLPHKTDDEKKAAKSLLRKLGNAGQAHGVTVRKTTQEDAKKGVLTVTFWVRDRIAHKDAAAAAAASAE